MQHFGDRSLAPQNLHAANPLARFSHRERFATARRIVLGEAPASVFDYGTGKGYFLDILAASGVPHLLGYDPFETGPRVVSDMSAVEGPFDTITCLEVLEHLDEAQTETLLADVGRLLAPSGCFVASVPVMIGPVGFFKVVKEWRGSNLLHKDKYTLGAALRCLVGRPPKQRWRNRQGIYHHLGFDHRVLRPRLARSFESIRVVHSPFAWLPSGLASQAFFVCRGAKAP